MLKRRWMPLPLWMVLGLLAGCGDTVTPPQPTPTPDPGVDDPSLTPEVASPTPRPETPPDTSPTQGAEETNPASPPTTSPTPGPSEPASASPTVQEPATPTPATPTPATPTQATPTPATPTPATPTPATPTVTPEPTPQPVVDQDQDGATSDRDCDDTNPAIFPGATEVCDNLDNNCDGKVDEEGGSQWYPDADQDGYTSNQDGVVSCNQPEGMAPASSLGDCDDTNDAVWPGATEVCNGIDDNCDFQGEAGAIDATTWYLDRDGDGYGSTDTFGPGCEAPDGTSPNNTDCDDDAPVIYPGAAEVCDGADNNCNTLVDENGDTPFYADEDGDGYGSPGQVGVGCKVPEGYASVEGDCGPGDNTVYPGAAEICDGQDNNCDGDTDEAGGVEWMADGDNDGAGDPAETVVACEMPGGYVPTTGPVDCDDEDPASYPGADEQCDGVDNSCDGAVDEGVVPTWYRDVDGDTWGDDFNTRAQCGAPTGFVGRGDDCNDRNLAINPGATEVCDGQDNNCDGVIDEGLATPWYLDADKDGYGGGSPLTSCKAPSPAYISTGGDCDDLNPAINPAGSEVCDGKDNNCDGQVDNNAPDATVWYADADDDGYGDNTDTVVACAAPSGFVEVGGDCDDADDSTSPSSPELCDGYDNNCDGDLDSGAAGSAPECASPSCKDLLAARPGITSNYYWVQPVGAAAAFEVFCDMVRAGGGWTRIYYQDTSTNTFFAATDFELNKQEPRSSKYAILNDLESFRRGGKFELLMSWPGSSFTDFQQWYQSNNPVTDAPGTLPTGYQAIHIPYTYQGWTGGLQRSYYTQYSLLDGTMDPLGNWYYAVGTTYSWNPLPNAMPGPTGGVAKAELYVR